MREVAFILFLLLSKIGLSQSLFTIKGEVKSEIAGDTLIRVSIYLNQTSIGTLSGKNGEFTLSNVPAGKHELILSCVGYETQRILINTEEAIPFLIIRLKTKADELATVVVEPFERDGWIRWGELFRNNFIGSSKNARQCKLRNPGALRFRRTDKGTRLHVIATEPLQLENEALGYSIQFDLEEFVYNFNTQAVFFQGFCFFSDKLKQGNKRQTVWNANRTETYRGSLNHFMYALYHDRITQDGFELYKEKWIANAEKNRVRRIMEDSLGLRVYSNPRDEKTYVFGNPKKKDSMAYYNKIIQQPDFFEQVDSAQLYSHSLIKKVTDSTGQLNFADRLRVLYRGETEAAAYARIKGQNKRKPFQSSSLQLIDGKSVFINPTGFFYEAKDIILHGYWAWEGIADLMPYDYRLNE